MKENLNSNYSQKLQLLAAKAHEMKLKKENMLKHKMKAVENSDRIRNLQTFDKSAESETALSVDEFNLVSPRMPSDMSLLELQTGTAKKKEIIIIITLFFRQYNDRSSSARRSFEKPII